MCIAIYSPAGNKVPCEDYLRNSFDHNPDGAGFAYNLPNHTVQIEKGFMDYKSFSKAFKKAARKHNFTDCGVLIHFRITTHGGTNQQCCHPFPLVADENIMKKTKVKTDYAVIHNGIISMTSEEAKKRDHMSDTMVFIERYLSKIASNKKWFNNKSNFELIYDMIGSKMAILNGYGAIHSTAGFTKDKDGNWYSNTTYKEPRIKYYWGDYDYYEGYGYSYGTGYKSYKKDKSAEDSVVSLSTIKAYDEKIAYEKNDDEPTTIIAKEGLYYEPLMLLKKNQMAEIDGFDYEYDDYDPVLMDSDNRCYLTSPDILDESNDNFIYGNDLWFVGYGVFFDKYSATEVDFRPDYTGIFAEEDECVQA